MFQILIPQKQSIVKATITSEEDWLLVYSLFTKWDTRRFSLQSINTCLSRSFNGNTIPINIAKDLLKGRIVLLALLIEVLAKEEDSRSVDVLNAVSDHQRTTKILFHIFANMPEKTNISQNYLQQQLTVLGVAATNAKKVKGDFRERLNIQQDIKFIYQKVSYNPCYNR